MPSCGNRRQSSFFYLLLHTTELEKKISLEGCLIVIHNGMVVVGRVELPPYIMKCQCPYICWLLTSSHFSHFQQASFFVPSLVSLFFLFFFLDHRPKPKRHIAFGAMLHIYTGARCCWKLSLSCVKSATASYWENVVDSFKAFEKDLRPPYIHTRLCSQCRCWNGGAYYFFRKRIST